MNPTGSPDSHPDRPARTEPAPTPVDETIDTSDASEEPSNPDADTVDSAGPKRDAPVPDRSPLPEAPPPETAGRYPIVRELGRGGMGVVYLASDPSLGRTVALKRLPAPMAGNATRLEEFRQEARLLASINHPNIATIYSLEEDEDGSFLTMEAIEGETLARRLTRGAPPLQETLQIARQVARALEAAHRQGVVHRDLKPGNIMFTAQNEVKVLDFGLATTARTATNPESRSVSGSAPGAGSGVGSGAASGAASGVGSGPASGAGSGPASGPASTGISGTPGYMSPEQLRGEPPDPVMDVWAFGCVLYECLTGARAVRGTTARDLMRNTLDAVIDLERLPPRTPEALREILAQCLRRSGEERTRELTEVRRTIEGLLAEASFVYTRSSRGGDEGSVPNNLPRHTSSFVGRTKEVAAIRELLDGNSIITLTGMGGVGKTRLALRVAEDLLQGEGDGVWLVELAPVADPHDVADTMMRAIGIPQAFDRPALESIVAHLSGRRALIVLDNCEHVLDSVATIVRAIVAGAPEVQILATSREHLAIAGEASFPVPRFDVPASPASLDVEAIIAFPAVELFLQRARQVRPSLTLDAAGAAAVVEICRRLDGIPLAIELAASRLKALSIEDVRQRLDDRFRLLTGGTRDSLPHHRTLRALVDWSYDQLEPEEQALLGRLSVFAGGWTLEAAEEVAAGGLVNDWDILDISSRLVDRSLIEVDVDTFDGTTRFRMLETVKAYAAERLEESGQTRAMAIRHRDYFAALVSTAEPQFTGERQSYWFSRLDAEHEDVGRAFETCADEESDPMIGLRMSGSLFRYWITRGHWNEAYQTSRQVLARAGTLPPNIYIVKVLNTIAAVALYHGRLDEARENWERALESSVAIDHEHGVATARLNLGNVAFTAGDYDTARRHYSEALTRFRNLGLIDGIGRGLVSLGNVALSVGNYEECRSWGLEASELMRAHGHTELLAHALIVAGTAELRLENLEGARTCLEESLEIQKRLGDRRNGAIATLNLGVVFHRLERLPDARRCFAQALSTFHALGDVTTMASAMDGLCSLAMDLDRIDLAIKSYSGANALRKRHHMPRMPDEEAVMQKAFASARQSFGAERVDELMSGGASMDTDALVAWLLEEMGSE